MKSILSVLMLLLYPLIVDCQRLVPPRRYNYDNDEEVVIPEENEEPDDNNTSKFVFFFIIIKHVDVIIKLYVVHK